MFDKLCELILRLVRILLRLRLDVLDQLVVRVELFQLEFEELVDYQ